MTKAKKKTRRQFEIKFGEALRKGMLKPGVIFKIVKDGDRWKNTFVGIPVRIKEVGTESIDGCAKGSQGCDKNSSCGCGYMDIYYDENAVISIGGRLKNTWKAPRKDYTSHKVKGWKFLNWKRGKIVSDADSSCVWRVGKKKSILNEDTIQACDNGFHMSGTVVDALEYVQGPILAYCEGAGDCDNSNGDKTAHRSMTILKAWRMEDDDDREKAGFIESRENNKAKVCATFDVLFKRIGRK